MWSKGLLVCFQIENFDKTQKLTIDPRLEWSTYYGGNAREECNNSKLDNSGHIYLCGSTASPNFIAYLGFQNNFISPVCAFIAKFSTDGIRKWSSYYGSYTSFRSVEVDKKKNVVAAGYIADGSLSNYSYNGHQNYYGGGTNDGLIVKFDSLGSRIWASYYGGSMTDILTDCEIDSNNAIVVCGHTNSLTDISHNGYQNRFYLYFQNLILLK